MNSMVRFVSWTLVAAATLVSAAAHAGDPPPAPAPAAPAAPARAGRRVAVIVGANDPAPGRQPLRYSHADAQMLADTLVQVGRFAKNDVRVLLEPKPNDVLAALDGASRELQSAPQDSLLLFYYSGHSDGQHVYPHGEKLPLVSLRERLGQSTARVRIAIVDTCRGGSWTRAKGLTVGPALDAIDLMNVSTEGTALLSSSSGMESAHEAGSLKGSFFTHHLNAGLLGAADTSGDGNVTLQEAFVYARERTVRDSARMAATTQHPSFDMQLRGRQDIVLAQTKASRSALQVTQKNPLEIIHLGSGATVVETPPGAHKLRLALVPGRYVVRRVESGRVLSKEIAIAPDATVNFDEAQLESSGDRLALKATDPETGEPAGEGTPGAAAPETSAKQPDAKTADCVPCCDKDDKSDKTEKKTHCCKKRHKKKWGDWHKKEPSANKRCHHGCNADCRCEDIESIGKAIAEAAKEDEDCDDDEMWEKTTVIGVRGSITWTDGAETDGTYAGAMAQVAAEQFKTEGLWTARGSMNLALGGGSAALEGSLAGTITGGIRIPVTENQGPILRGGIGGEMTGNSRFYFSRLSLPVLEVGYQYLKDRTVLEVGARGAAIITGRYNTGHRTRRELGDGSLEWGGYLAAHAWFGRLDVSVSRIEARDEFPGGPVNVGRAWLCGHIVDKVAVCGDVTILDGGASYFIPPRIETNVTSVYGGLTVGLLQF